MNPSALVFFPASALALGCVTLILVRCWVSTGYSRGDAWTRTKNWASRIPYTVVLLVFGAIFAVLMRVSGSSNSMRSPFLASAEFWIAVDPPDVLLYVFLPPLLYHGASADWHYVSKARWKILGLAFPVVFLTCIIVGVLVQIVPVFPPGTPVEVGIMLGALLSATDPVAVVAVLKESGASKSLRSVVDGESLLNDGSSLVIFVEALRTVSKRSPDDEWVLDSTAGRSLSVLNVSRSVLRATAGGVLVGVLTGLIVAIFFAILFGRAKERVARNERAVLTVTLTIAAAYGSFIVAQQIFDVSGAVAVVVLGFFMARQGAYFIEPVATEYMHSFWSTMDFIINTIIFTYSGAASASIIITEDSGPAHLTFMDWIFIPALYILLQVVRFGGVLVLNWTLSRVTNDRLSLAEQTVISLSGLRGSVSLILALMVVHRLEDPTGLVAPRIAIWTAGIVMMTLMINGTVIGDLCHGLSLTKKSEAQLEIARLLRRGVGDGVVTLILKMRGSQRFPTAEWTEIQSFFIDHGLISSSAFDTTTQLHSRPSSQIGGVLRHSDTMVMDFSAHELKARLKRAASRTQGPDKANTSVDSLFFDADDIQMSRQSSPRKTHKIPTVKIALTGSRSLSDESVVLDGENRRRILLVIRRSLFEQFQNGMMSPGIIQVLEAEIMEALDNIESPLNLFSALEKYTTGKRWLVMLGRSRYFIRHKLIQRLIMSLNYYYVEESVSTWTAVWAALSAVRSRYWLKGACLDEVQTERVKIIERLKEITAMHPEVTRVFDSRLAATVVLRGAQKAVEKLSAKGSATQAEADSLLRELEMLEGKLTSYFRFELNVNVKKVLRVESPLRNLDDVAFKNVYQRGRHEVLSKGELVLPESASNSLGLSILIHGSVSAANRPMPNVAVQHEDSPLLPAIQLSNDYDVVVFPRGSPLGALKALTDTPTQTLFRVESPTATIFHLDQRALESCCRQFPELETSFLRWCAVQIVRHVAPRFSDIDLGDYGVLASEKRISSKESIISDVREATEDHVGQTSTIEEVAYKESRRFVAFLLRDLQSADILHLEPNKTIERPGSLDGVVFKGTIRTLSKSGAIINAPGIFSSPTSSIRAGPAGALLALCQSPDDTVENSGV